MRAIWRLSVLVVALFGISSVASAQTKKTSASDDYYNLFEFNVFGGVAHYGRNDSGLGTQFKQGGVVGIRLTENPFRYFGIEENLSLYSWNDLRFFQPVHGNTLPEFETHIYQGALNAVGYMTPRESKVRPFLTAGFGVAIFAPSDDVRKTARSLDPSLGFSSFGRDTRIQGNYGAGIKFQVHPRVGLRADVRGLVNRQPRLGISPLNTGGAYIPDDTWMQGVQATAGLTFYFGRKEKPAPPPPPPPPPPTPTPHSISAGSISASTTSVCPGDTVRLSSNASDPNGHRLSYAWSVDGRAQGGNAPDFTWNADGSGDHRIGLHVADTASENPAAAVDVSAVSIQVKTYTRPNVSSVTANPSELARGQTSAVHATATGSECSGTLSYSWSASEGTVSGSGADGQYNSSSVSFNEGDRSRPQSKQVTVTANVTDSKGGAASGSANITVNYPAQVKHFGDILFPKGSSRVNNCAKRVLIEQLYPMLAANTNYDVVLVGHIDTAEVPKGKSSKGRSLDRDRVMNTAGVLSGGSGTCTSLEHSRIKGSWVGATQETESLPTSCTVSTVAPKERRGNEVDPSEAKNRRVEIWLVPKGLSVPAAAKDAKELPEADLKKIGCPK